MLLWLTATVFLAGKERKLVDDISAEAKVIGSQRAAVSAFRQSPQNLQELAGHAGLHAAVKH